jgi:hypothetical protein
MEPVSDDDYGERGTNPAVAATGSLRGGGEVRPTWRPERGDHWIPHESESYDRLPPNVQKAIVRSDRPFGGLTAISDRPIGQFL